MVNDALGRYPLAGKYVSRVAVSGRSERKKKKQILEPLANARPNPRVSKKENSVVPSSSEAHPPLMKPNPRAEKRSTPGSKQKHCESRRGKGGHPSPRNFPKNFQKASNQQVLCPLPQRLIQIPPPTTPTSTKNVKILAPAFPAAVTSCT